MNKSFCPILIAAMLMYPAASDAASLQITPGGILTGATNVNVNGTFYNVQFAEGTINSVYGSTNPADFDFQSEGDALAAASALNAQVFVNVLGNLFDTNPESVIGISNEVQLRAYIPYGFSSVADLGHPFSLNAYARNHEQEFLDSALSQIVLNESDDTSVPFSAETPFDGGGSNWARFTPVPEPSSLALLGLGGLLIARRRRG